MATERTDFGPSVEIPNTDGPVVGSGDEDGVGWVCECGMVLQTHDSIGVPLS